MTGLTDIPQEQMEEAMQRACDEQAKIMEEHEKRQIRKANQEKSLVDWAPEHEYEKIKCNKTPEEERKIVDDTVKFIKNQYGDVLRKLSKT